MVLLPACKDKNTEDRRMYKGESPRTHLRPLCMSQYLRMVRLGQTKTNLRMLTSQ